MAIRIMLADDHKITREGLRSLLEKQNDLHVVCEAEDGRQAVEKLQTHKVDVVIMDVTMPDLNGIEAAKKISRDYKRIKIVGLSMHSDPLFVAEMLKSGASGYLLKDCAFEELATAIRHVMVGKVYLSPAISETVVGVHVKKMEKNESADILTNREREVLQLMAEGVSTREISKKLFISIKTVETHRRQIMHKLNMHTVAELTKYAIRLGLTSLEP